MFHKVYLFEGELIFWPDRNILSDDTGEKKAVQLTGPASRCLELLVSRMDLVSQNELYEYAWKGSGFTPSPNTLYQSISVLRRAFKELDGNGTPYILTETRKGFRVNPELRVSSELREFVTGQEDEDVPEAVAEHATAKAVPVKSNAGMLRAIFAAALFAIAIVSCFVAYDNAINKKRVYFSEYQRVSFSPESGCVYFLPPKVNGSVLGKIDLSRLSCKDRPFNYVTTHAYSPKVSIISCDKTIDSRQGDCSSLFLWEGNENE